MRITGRIWIGIAPLLAGYIVSQVVNTYSSIENEELLTRSVEAVDGALDGKDIDGALNNDASPDDPAKKRKTPIAFIPPEPEDDKQLQDAIDLLIGLQKSAAGRPAPNS